MNKDPKLLAAIAKLNKEHGSGTVVFGNEIHWDSIPRIRSGSLALDVILNGGWTVNQWHMLVGHYSSGKSSIAMKMIAFNQSLDPNWTAWWAASEPFDKSFARTLGVDLDRLIIHDTNVLEEALTGVLEITQAQVVDCVVIDSYPAMVPRKEEEGESGDAVMGIGARLMNQFWRMQGSTTRRSLVESQRPVTCFLLTQYRDTFTMFGDPRVIPGGKGQLFAMATELEVKRAEYIKPGGKDSEPAGITISCFTVKNKTGRPNRKCEIDFYFADTEGHPAGSYDKIKDLLAVGIAYGVLKSPDGRWFEYESKKMNGRKGIAGAMQEDPAMADRLTKEIMQIINPSKVIVTKPAIPVIKAPMPKMPKPRA